MHLNDKILHLNDYLIFLIIVDSIFTVLVKPRKINNPSLNNFKSCFPQNFI